MNRVVTTVVGTFVESWQELRVHRGRVVLSLVGVTIAVASLAVPFCTIWATQTGI